MTQKKFWESACLLGCLICGPLMAACSDDEGGGGETPEGTELSIPSSVVDGVRITGVTSSDANAALTIKYNSDGSPESASIGGQDFTFEYAPDQRATATGRKLVSITAKQTNEEMGENAVWKATNFAFNTDGFIASYQEVTDATDPYGWSHDVVNVTLTYGSVDGRLQRVSLMGTSTGEDEGESWSESGSLALEYVYTSGSLTQTSLTSDGETYTYTYDYGTSAHANTYNVMTPQLAAGLALYSPILYVLAHMGYAGNASAMLPTTCTLHNSSYDSDGPGYDETHVYELTYHFWDDNRIRSIESSMGGGPAITYGFTYEGN